MSDTDTLAHGDSALRKLRVRVGIPLAIVNALTAAYLVSPSTWPLLKNTLVGECVVRVTFGLHLGQLGTLITVLTLIASKSQPVNYRGMSAYGAWLLSCMAGIVCVILSASSVIPRSDARRFLLGVFLFIPVILILVSLGYFLVQNIILAFFETNRQHCLALLSPSIESAESKPVRFRLTHLLVATTFVAIFAIVVRSMSRQLVPNDPVPALSSILIVVERITEYVLLMFTPYLLTRAVLNRHQRFTKVIWCLVGLMGPSLALTLGGVFLRLPDARVMAVSFAQYVAIQFGQIASIAYIETALYQASYRLMPGKIVEGTEAEPSSAS